MLKSTQCENNSLFPSTCLDRVNLDHSHNLTAFHMLIFICTVYFCHLHVLQCCFITVLRALLSSCTVKLYTYTQTLYGCSKATEKHCCSRQIDSDISLLYIDCPAPVMCCVNRELPSPCATAGLQQGAASRKSALTWTLTLWSSPQAQEQRGFNLFHTALLLKVPSDQI